MNTCLRITNESSPFEIQQGLHLLADVDWKAADYLATKLKNKRLKNTEMIYFCRNHTGQLIGFAALLLEDIISKADFGPFLSTVYVNSSYRKQGFSYQLVNKIELFAKHIGYTKIYTITQHVGLYEKMNYHFFCQGVDDMGRDVRVLEKNL
ncbi:MULTISPECIES: GNAT family N-acetyltransferase [Aerococcus]|uniref:GNAT family N-acetyltransferase n=2 Tax=Aerococcus TaxID=1375 RepID=A0A1E9PEC2_9LACT|nr:MULTISPECIES: GNAT family N-acetyltransferase [Aerococcus]KAA9242150.1 GNAT family N-acetyltransferase [Aerococcus urinae]KAA9290885.1 GNAT family N-acetyltransferase [Aerococcus mictus]MCY3034049.1 GNAT family N-acetyltransferase [Aerococcus mictus]MCY3064266.1 GNAT family N-acetyltransferase [Aerococcus mictus]MCY3064768.1 GNAT family N-acetyltransferase [Aerococcus mictus]